MVNRLKSRKSGQKERFVEGSDKGMAEGSAKCCTVGLAENWTKDFLGLMKSRTFVHDSEGTTRR